MLQPPTLAAEHLIECIAEVFSEKRWQLRIDGFISAYVQNLFERRIQVRYATIEINSQQADIDRFDDRFVDFLQERQFGGALFLLLIEQAVFYRHRNIAGN